MAQKKFVLNFFQTIAVTGLCTTAAAQIGLMLIDKQVENFWMLYPSFAAMFLLGSVIKYFHLDQVDDHHHH